MSRVAGTSPIYIVVNSVVSPKSMSGGDRLFVEWSKRWPSRGYPVQILACKDGQHLCEDNGLGDVCQIISWSTSEKIGVIPSYILRIIEASFSLLSRSIRESIVYSSSDFLTDIIPALLLKIKDKGMAWVSGLYLISPNPFKGESKLSLRSIAYYFSQRLAILLMKKYTDMIFVLNDEDKNHLVNFGIASKRVEVVSGGVDLSYISSIESLTEKSYDACFIGRFHQQKGLPDLIDIWGKVCKKKLSAKLAIIGWGDFRWRNWLTNEIDRRKLKNNIDLLGFLDNDAKFQVLKSSRIFLLPSYRESWAIVVCEAMASGLPVITYDLPVIRRIYRKGTVSIPIGDTARFSDAILELLENTNSYKTLSKDALEIASEYDWDKTATKALGYILKLNNVPQQTSPKQ